MAAFGGLGVQPVIVLRDDLLGQVPDVPVKVLALQPAMRSWSRRILRDRPAQAVLCTWIRTDG